jgi:hypothetical protein
MEVFVLRGVNLFEVRGGIIYPVSSVLGAFSSLKMAEKEGKACVDAKRFTEYKINIVTLDVPQQIWTE